MVKLVPPSALDVEQAYLGILLTDREAAQDTPALLSLGNFYSHKHELIYEAIHDMSSNGEPVDLITVHEKLKSEGLSEEVGGAFYLSELTSKAELGANVQYYATIITEYAMRRKAIQIMTEQIRSMYDLGSDVFESLGEIQQSLFDIESGSVNRGGIMGMETALDIAYSHLESVDGAEDGITGIGTGYHKLDDITGGWQNGDLIIIAARPSMGKTALALNMARNSWVKYGVPIGVFSFEMNNRSLAQRVLTAEARVDATRARNGQLNKEEWDQLKVAKDKLRGINIFLDDSADSSVSYVVSRARKMVRDGAKCIIIDYLQLMSSEAGNREQEIAKITRALKKLAMELDIPIILLSQLNRGVEYRTDKRPVLADLRESGAIEQDADIVGFVYRAERYGVDVDEEGNSTKGIGEFIISKHRNGRLGIVTLAFIEQYARFENLTTHYVPSDYNFTVTDEHGQSEIEF